MAVDSDLDLDVGLLRIVRRDGGGELEPVSAAAGSRLGARTSFAVLDESHLWTRANRGDRLADVLRRNCSKTGGRTFETSNAFAAGEGSVCEATHEAAMAGADGLLYVVQQGPAVDDLTDSAAVRAALELAYGDARAWADLARIAEDMADPNAPEDSMRRYHLGHITSGGSPMDVEKWKTLARSGRVVEDGAYCAAGFDGSFSADATAWVKCTADGFLFGARVWSRPEGASKDWRVPRAEVADTMTRYQVGRAFFDPFLRRDEIDQWVGEWNTGGNEVVLVLPTNVAKRFSTACDRFTVAIEEGRVTHDGDERLTQALAACTKKQVRVADDPRRRPHPVRDCESRHAPHRPRRRRHLELRGGDDDAGTETDTRISRRVVGPAMTEWQTPRDHDRDLVALLAAAWLNDVDGGVEILDDLREGQALVLLWSAARWWCWAWRNGHDGDALGTLRRMALQLAQGEDGDALPDGP